MTPTTCPCCNEDIDTDSLTVDMDGTLYHADCVDEVNADLDERDAEDDWLDGDAESALASAGWGTDEEYGYYGDA